LLLSRIPRTASASRAMCGCKTLSATSLSRERSRARHTRPKLPEPRSEESRSRRRVPIAHAIRDCARLAALRLRPRERSTCCGSHTPCPQRAETRKRMEPLRGISEERTIDRSRNTRRTLRPEKTHWRNVRTRRILSRQRSEAHRAKLPLIARRRRVPSVSQPFGGMGTEVDAPS
jgi:hypothetical protein